MEADLDTQTTTTENTTPQKPRITVFGIGGGGGNAVNNMIRSKLKDVYFVIANTDAQVLATALTENRIQLGEKLTRGLGAGARPDIGRAAAEEQINEIKAAMEGSNMVFVAAGMGGGTGTGAAPVIARIARESGILTVGVVTKPFLFEGVHRMRTAESGIAELQQYVDTLIVIPNQNLFKVANSKTTFTDAFKMADDVLYAGVRGVTDLMVMPGLINLDFADIRTVMSEMGKAMMGTGEASGDRRAIEAAEAAISNPLLDDVSLKGAKALLINISGGSDISLFEVDEAVNRIRDEVDQDANIIFGSTLDESMNGRIRISIVATGIERQGSASESARAPGTIDAMMARRNPFMTGLQQRHEKAGTASYFGKVTTPPLRSSVNVRISREEGANALHSSKPSSGTSPVGTTVSYGRANNGDGMGTFTASSQAISSDENNFYFDADGIEVGEGAALDNTNNTRDPAGVGGMHKVSVSIEKKHSGHSANSHKGTLLSKVNLIGKAAKKLMGSGTAAQSRDKRHNPRAFDSAASRGMEPQKDAVAETPPLPERPKRTSADDELLDIPAFLRRQSN